MRCQTEQDHRHNSIWRSSGVGHSEVIAGWYEEFSDILLKYLARLTHSVHEAQDIAQEAFMHMMCADPSEPIHNPKAFLFTTALNLLKDHYRRAHTRAMRKAVQLDEVEIPDWCEPSQVIEGEQALAQITDTLGQLGPATRKALLLDRVELCSHPEIAARMGVTVSMVEKHVRYAMDAFESVGFKVPRRAVGGGGEMERHRGQRAKRATENDHVVRRARPARRRKTAQGWRWDKAAAVRQLAMVQTRTTFSKCLQGYGAQTSA